MSVLENGGALGSPPLRTGSHPSPRAPARSTSGPAAKLRVVGVAVLAAAALPALAYLLPSAAVLRHMGQKRDMLQLTSLEVTGTLQAEGPTADRIHAAAGQPAGGSVNVPARILLRIPGRCRLEISGATPAESPALVTRDGRLEGGLESDPAAAALVHAVCTLLASSTAGDASATYAAALGRRGIALADETLGRFDGRIAYVIGGRPREPKPLLYVDKDAFQPLRLVAPEGGVMQDVRLLGWGSPTGGDWFPRAVEVVQDEQLRLRFTTEKTSANPKIPEALL
jgi:hypothetical protein